MKIYTDSSFNGLPESNFNDSLSGSMINRLKYSLVKNRNGDFMKSLRSLENKTIAVTYSGGLIPDIKVYFYYISNYIFRNNNATRILLFTNGYVGLINNSFIEITRKDFEDNPEKSLSYISTCRNCNPAAHRDTIIETLIRNRVDYWLIIGGDGTLRSINELIEGIENSHKLNTGFLFIPSTIDGMHMTENILGQESSERSMTELIKNLNENSWNTLDYELNVKSSRISIYEVPGRDHNFLIMNMIDRLCREGYTESTSSQFLIVLSNKSWKLADLINRISGTDKKIALLIAEGASEPEDYSRYSSAPFTIEGLKKIINEHCGTPSNFHKFDKLGQTGLPSEVYSINTHLQASEWARQTILLMASMSRNRNAFALTYSKNGFTAAGISELEYYNNGRNEEYHKLKQEFIENKIREYADTDYIIICS